MEDLQFFDVAEGKAMMVCFGVLSRSVDFMLVLVKVRNLQGEVDRCMREVICSFSPSCSSSRNWLAVALLMLRNCSHHTSSMSTTTTPAYFVTFSALNLIAHFDIGQWISRNVAQLKEKI